MSQPSSDQQKTPKEIEISRKCDQRSNREVAAAIRASALAAQDPLTIFKLNIDCWEVIFDWLSLDDLHAFGQTCKYFHRIAGEYFKWKYKRVLGDVYDKGMTINWGDFNGFNEFTQRLSFYSRNPDASLLYALTNCKSPREMEIVNGRSSEIDLSRLENMLKNIEILKISNFHVSTEFLESFLQRCAKSLKRLMLDVSLGNSWMNNCTYPQLQHLSLFECDHCDELIKFFEKNPNVRSFATSAALILKNLKEFTDSTMRLDDLTILRNDDIDAITIALNRLYEGGIFKRLHFKTATSKHLIDLPGLSTLHIDTYNYIKMPDLSSVTSIAFQALWNGLCSWMNMEELSIALKNLQCIFTPETNAKYMMPFIRNSTKLKEIKMEYFRGDHGHIDPVTMSNERKRLHGAHKVSIYVEEKDFLMVKWKYNKSDFGLIEIKRKESYDGVWDRTFGYY